MTPHEIVLAYDGLLERIEIEGNAMLMAIRQQNVKKAKPIKLRNDNQQNGKSDTSVKQSTVQKREETFKALGII
jgi:hypothetical protein